MNYAIFMDDPDLKKSFSVPFQMMIHGAKDDMIPMNLSGDGFLYVDETYLLFRWDNENIYYNIQKHTEEYLIDSKIFEINLPTPNDIWET